jgi:hypothetical protein
MYNTERTYLFEYSSDSDITDSFAESYDTDTLSTTSEEFSESQESQVFGPPTKRLRFDNPVHIGTRIIGTSEYDYEESSDGLQEEEETSSEYYCPVYNATSATSSKQVRVDTSTRPVTRSWAQRTIRPTNYSTKEQREIRVQLLNPSTVVIDKTTKSYKGNKHTFQPGWNCWTVKPLNQKSLIVNQVRKTVCFTEETTYYSEYGVQVRRREEQFGLIVWVRTCESLIRRVGYQDPVNRRFPYYVGITWHENEYTEDIIPTKPITHILDCDRVHLQEYKTFHPKPIIVQANSLRVLERRGDFCLISYDDYDEDTRFPVEYPGEFEDYPNWPMSLHRTP